MLDPQQQRDYGAGNRNQNDSQTADYKPTPPRQQPRPQPKPLAPTDRPCYEVAFLAAAVGLRRALPGDTT
jgi:hypothetical protein